MICVNCNAELIEGVKFCSNCGASVNKQEHSRKTIHLCCKSCGGEMNVDVEQNILSCQYCGSSELISDSDEVMMEKIRSQTQKEIENSKLKIENEKNRAEEEKEEIEAFKKSKFSKVLIIFAIIFLFAALSCFASFKILAGFIALGQAALLAISWLIGMHSVKAKHKNEHMKFAIIGFALIIPFWSIYNFSFASLLLPIVLTAHTNEEYEWPESGISNMLPKPESSVGKITTDTESNFNIEVYKVSKEQFKTFAEDCKEKGFEIDISKSDDYFYAYNEDMYELDLKYSPITRKLSVYLSAPMEMKEIQWKNIAIASVLPEPISKVGNISIETSDSLSIFIGEISEEQYYQYVNSCIENGFDIDYSRSDNYFVAENHDGYSLTVGYEANNTMYIWLENY